MADITNLSDDQLLALSKQPDISAIPNDQLLAMQQAAPVQQMQGWQREVALPASGLATGAVSSLGLPGDIFRSGVNLYSKYIGAPLENLVKSQIGDQTPTPVFSGHNPIDSQTLLSGSDQMGLTNRPDLVPQGMRERYENSAAEGMGALVPAALLGGVPLASLPKALGQMASAGVGSQAGQDITPDHPVAGSIIGSLIGGGLARGATNLARGAGAPSAETAQLAQLARDTYGIPVVGGQITESPTARFTYSQLKKVPFSGVNNDAVAQQEAFNQAVSQTFGENATKITPDILNAARSRIGQDFNNVAARTNIPMDNTLLNNLKNVVDNAELSMSADSVTPIQNQAMNIANTGLNNNGVISGKAYQDLTAKGGPLDTMMQSNDSGLRQAGIQLRSALDDALQRNAHPDDVSILQDARSQWKALKTVEPLTLRADTIGGGATPSTGDISPAALRGAVNQSYGNAATAGNGAIPLNDLARIGQRFLKEPGDSNTATREMINHGLASTGAIGAGIIGGHEAGIPMLQLLLGTGGGLLAGRAAGSALRSDLYTNRLINSGLASRQPLGPTLGALPILAADPTIARSLQQQ